MPSSRARRGRGEDDAGLGARWSAAVQDGSPLEDLEADVLAAPADQMAAGIRGLASASGADAVPLLLRLSRSPRPEAAVGAVEALGEIRSPAVAEALDEIARSSGDRAVQKAARRSIHRLRSQGIRAEPTEARPPASVGSRTATIYRAIASAYDGTGTRSLWFGADRPLGGIYLVALAINDVQGLVDCFGQDTTRKRFAEREATMREKDPMAWVELPADYARQLVEEAAATTRAAGSAVPSTYPLWAELVGSPTEPFSQALVYQEISGFEVRMHPTLEGESPRLFTEPEIEPWFFPPDRVQKWTRQLAESSTSRLIVTLESDEARQERLVREAVRELLGPLELQGLRRRLEETAYTFLRTDRLTEARRAVAAAVTIEEERPLRPPHPFARALVERSLRIALQVERSGGEPLRLARAP